MADREIKIIVDLKDNTQGKAKAIAQSLLEMDKVAQRLNNRFKAFATMKYTATLNLIDRVTAPATRLNSLLKRITGRAYRIAINLSDGALSGVRKLETALARLTSKAYNLNVGGALKNQFGGLMSGAAMGAGIFAPVAGMAGVGFGVANAVQSYAGFQQQMSKVQAIRQLDKNSPEMQALTEQAKELGRQTAWTRQQVGEAQFYQALAGWQTEQILKATPHMLNLASAGGLDLGRTADIVTDTMTAFGIKAGETYRNKQGQTVDVAEGYMDLLAKIQAISNTDISQAGEALKYSAPVLGTIGRDKSAQERMQIAQDALIMTGLMADAGIKGSMAGTSLRAVFSRFSSQNRNALFGLRALGIEVDKNGEMLMPGEIMRNLRQRINEGIDPNQLLEVAEAFAGEKIHADTRRKLDSFINDTIANGGKIGSADLMKMATMLAGQEAMSGLLAILSGDWDKKASEMDKAAGSAKEMADIMMDNLAGSFTRLGSAWDSFQQDLMEGKAGDGLRDFVDALTEIIARADKLFSDGISFGDIGKVIGDVVGRLKNKFLELDGIGSVLAGGALMGALMKLTTMSRNLLTNLRGVKGTAGATSAGQKIGTMNISAGVVNVNGKISGGSAGRSVGNRAIIDNYNRTKERIRGSTTPVVSPFSNFKSAAGYGAAFAGIFGAFDLMNLKSVNAERLAQAAPSERAAIIKENRAAEWEAGAGLTGSVIGAALGAGLGSLAGPLGTTIGGMIGATLGDYLGRIIGEKGSANEKPVAEKNYFKEEQSARTVSQAVMSAYADKKKDYEYHNEIAALRRLHGANMTQREVNTNDYFKAINDKLGAFSPFAYQDGGAFDYYKQQREAMTPEQFQWQMPQWGARAEAAELNAEQLAQQAAMERGEFIPPEMPEAPQLDTESFTENLYSQIEGMTEGIAELMTGLGETISESLASSFEGVGEFFSEFGTSITEGLTSTFEGVGEIFSTLGTSITEGLTSSLESVTQIFMSTKETICAAWAEVPAFFSGVFSGLGGAAESAGAAILSGLTSVCGAVIGAWEAVASTVSSIIASISAAASSVAGMIPSMPSFAVHAEGGFFTSPHFGLVAESGPELILPLSDPARATQLLQQHGGALLNELFAGDFSSDSLEQHAANLLSDLTGTNITGSDSNISAPVNVNVDFNISGADEPNKIINTIKDNLNDLTEQVAAQLTGMIQAAFLNRPLA